MVLDIGRDKPLLPGRKAASDRGSYRWCLRIESHELVRQNDAERLSIRAVADLLSFRKHGKLQRQFPKSRVLEIQPGCKICEAVMSIDWHPGRIKIEIGDPTEGSRLMPFIIFPAGRDECELFLQLPQ